MSLRRKILLAIGLLLAAVSLTAFLVQQRILTDNFARLEEREMHAHIRRAHQALAKELEQLESTCADWAYWDDTYEFIENANDAYLQSNLTDSTLVNRRLNLMVFVHSSGRIVADKAYDLQRQRAMPLPAGLSAHLARPSVLLEPREGVQGTSGILALPEGPLLIVALPILTSQNEGPRRGTLILGRFLDEDTIARLGQIVQLPLVARAWDDPFLPADFQSARAALTISAPHYTRPLDDQVIAGYALVTDVYARPALILRATMPREITQHGQISQRYLMALILFSGIIAYVLAMGGLDRLILARVGQLARQVHHISKRGTAAQRVVVTGDDELGALEREINRMLDEIAVSEERWRAYIEQTSDLIFTLDACARVTWVNQALCAELGYAWEEIIGKSPLEFVAPEARAQAQDALERVFRGEAIDHFETAVLTRTQQRLTLEVRGHVFREGNQTIGTLHIARDITARKDAEELLRQQAQMYRALIENISDVIMLTNEQRWIRFVSPSAESVFGYTPGDLLGMDLLELTHPDEREMLEEIFQHVLHDPWHTHRIEHRWRHRDGTWRECETIAQAYSRELGIDIAISTRDITERKQASAALDAERNLLRTVIDAIPNSIFVKDTQDRFLLNNAYHLETLGAATQEDTLGKSLFAFHPPDLAEQYHADDQYVLTTGQPIIEKEQPYMHYPRGERRWHLLTKVPLRNVQGEIIGIVGVGRDITERKKIEDELRRSRKEWQDIFNAIGHPTFILDLQHGVIAANPAALKQLGKTESEVLGKRCYELFHNSNSPPVTCPMETLLRTSKIETIEMEMETIAGTFLVSCTPVLDAQGNLEKVIHMATDITELKRVQTELQEANARFYALVEGIPDIVYLKDWEGRNLYVNKAYEDFAGTTRANIVGKRDTEILPPELATQNMASDALVLQKGTSVRIEESVTHGEDNTTWYETIKNPIYDTSGKIIGLVGVSRDITQRKQAEAVIHEYSERLQQLVEERTRELHEAQEQLVRQERLATLGQLAGSIAHELRSPLSAIKNAAYYLKMRLEHPDDDTREMVQILDEQVDASARIIESLLEFARPKLPVLKRVYLPYLIQATVEQHPLPTNITLQWDVALDLPDVLVDAAQMQIVFRNLITNAIQAMPTGGQLTIGVQTEGETLCATVSDTGHGIPPEALDKIFQPLYTTRAKGIGLGLALCKLIVEAHGGTITVTSQVGKGTTFTLTLPLITPSEEIP